MYVSMQLLSTRSADGRQWARKRVYYTHTCITTCMYRRGVQQCQTRLLLRAAEGRKVLPRTTISLQSCPDSFFLNTRSNTCEQCAANLLGSLRFRIEGLFYLDDARTFHAAEACDKNSTARALGSQRGGVGGSEQVPGTCLQSTKPEALNSVAHRPYHSRQSCCEDPLPLSLASS